MTTKATRRLVFLVYLLFFTSGLALFGCFCGGFERSSGWGALGAGFTHLFAGSGGDSFAFGVDVAV